MNGGLIIPSQKTKGLEAVHQVRGSISSAGDSSRPVSGGPTPNTLIVIESKSYRRNYCKQERLPPLKKLKRMLAIESKDGAQRRSN